MKVAIVNYPYGNPNRPESNPITNTNEDGSPSILKEYLTNIGSWNFDDFDSLKINIEDESDFSEDKSKALLFDLWETKKLLTALGYAINSEFTQYVELEIVI